MFAMEARGWLFKIPPIPESDFPYIKNLLNPEWFAFLLNLELNVLWPVIVVKEVFYLDDSSIFESYIQIKILICER